MTAPEPTIARNASRPTLQTDSAMALTHERLHATIDGHQLQGNTLADVVAGGTTLLVFLRHFG